MDGVGVDASGDVTEPPRKRQRRSPSPQQVTTIAMNAAAPPFEPGKGNMGATDQPKMTEKFGTGFQLEREQGVGILCFVNEENLGFEGVLKQRYTDFLVNEIMPNGEVAHLTDDRAPSVNLKSMYEAPQGSISAPVADETALQGVRNSNSSLPDASIVDDALSIPGESKHSDVRIVEDIDAKALSPSAGQAGRETSTNVSKTSFTISPEDQAKLNSYFGASFTKKIIDFHAMVLAKPHAKANYFGTLISEPIKDKAIRGKLHQDVRRIFESRLDTVATDESGIQFTAASRKNPNSGDRGSAPDPRHHNERGQAKGKLGWQELGGEYLQFSLYKENKDTIEVINFISRQLQVKPKDFSFAGTKDRRAVTVQRVSVFRQYAKNLARLNPMLRGSRVGNFTHEKHGLQLGELRGNQFHITLRDCHFGDDLGLDDTARVHLANKVVGQAVKHLQNHGFINYYGLQRFGTFGIGTDEIGKRILQSDFEGAVDAVLAFSDESLAAALSNEQRASSDRIGRDDIDRAHAIHMFKTTGKGKDALEKMPRKFSGESAVIRHLSSGHNRNDHQGALMSVTRNLRTMYVHAYQSLVWNMVASKRWVKYGSKVIAGDLVLVENTGSKSADAAKPEEYDENGEIIVLPAADDVAVTHDDLYERARPLSTKEAESGKYSIFDVVLPTPGFDIEYPSNDIGDYYKEFMKSESGGGLDPANMRRSQKDFSLSGSYRKLLAQVGKDMSFEIKIYHEENEQLIETDLEKLNKSRGRNRDDSRPQNRDNFYQQNRGGYGGRDNFRRRGSGRGRGFTRGGRHNPNYNHNGDYGPREWPDADPTMVQQQKEEKQEAKPEAKQEEDPNKRKAINAWASLPAKLAADDKAAYEAYTEAKRNAPPVNPDDIRQPVFTETFIQTSAEDEGRRTGYRSTKILSLDGAGDDPDEFVPRMRGGAGDDLELDVDHKPAGSDDADLTISAVAFDAAAEGTRDGKAEEGKPAKLAVIVKFDLGSSQYATMALRELMKAGGVKTYKPDFSGGR